MKILLHKLGIALIGISLLVAQPVEAKQLKCADMEFLNSVFEIMPNLTACILMAKKNCTQVIQDQQAILRKLKGEILTPKIGKTKALESVDDKPGSKKTKAPDNIDKPKSKKVVLSKTDIDLLLEYALTPIKDFFCHIKDRKGLITNLMKESFADFASNKDFEKLNLIEFLNSDSNDLLEYFGKRSAQNQEVVTDFLLEIEHMFNDFKDSMNKETLEAVKKHLVAVNKSHRGKVSNNKSG